MKEKSPTTIAPLLNRLISIFVYADKLLIFLAKKHKLLELLRYILVSASLFFLRILPSFFPSYLVPYGESYNYPLKSRKGPKAQNYQNYPTPTVGGGGGGGNSGGDSGISRALSQLLSLVSDIPVSSRKYEVVRSLAEKIIDENLKEGNGPLREVNCKVLSAAFVRTVSQLEAALLDQGLALGSTNDYYCYKLSRLVRGVKYYGEVLWQSGKPRDELGCKGSSAEKLAAELLWLAQKLAACGCAEEAVCKWASATNLAWLALSSEPRLQGSLVKVSAFLIKQAKDIGKEEEEEGRIDQFRQIKTRMLISWLPLLCRGSNGIDEPVLSISERRELEIVLEEMIEMLEQEEEQEQVLSLWLYHFIYCASSDWPNLHECYTRWCNASRRLLFLQW